jgi:threonyl-tRNA synthetase
VVGQDEMDNRAVNVRNRDAAGTKARGEIMPLEEVISKLVNLKAERRLENSIDSPANTATQAQ